MKPSFKLTSKVLTAICVLTSCQISASEPAWKDPQVFRINKEPARSFFYPSNDADAVFSMTPWEHGDYVLLNGQWRFNWVKTPDQAPEVFFGTDYDDSNWASIPVPANWELQGYGDPYYYNHPCIKPKIVAPDLPEDNNPVGSYRHTFNLPNDWQDKQVFVHFGAVKSAFYLWVNGKEVGYSEDSKTAAEFDLTPYVKAGENQLAMQVHRYSTGSYFECQDMWRMSGIERDVYIYATPKVRIQDFHAETTLSNNYSDGELTLTTTIENHTNSKVSNKQLVAALFDLEGKQVAQTELISNDIAAGASNALTWHVTVPNAALWSAETPNLYKLKITLLDNQGNPTQSVGRLIGFRSSELKNGNILVNGQPILFKGVNRHEHDPFQGHVISRDVMLEDVKLMKQFNINAVRLAHYPNDPYFYYLADIYGLYVMDEANIESHGMGAANQRGAYNPDVHIVNKPEWQGAYIDRVSNMYHASKNNPSVVFRSLGNESGDGSNIEAGYHWLKAQEPNFPVVSEQAQARKHTDVWGQMYAPLNDIVRYAENDFGNGRPAILVEYGHAMGNSMGNFQEYWDTFEKYPLLQGGFIWDWVDQTFARQSESGDFFWAYGGDIAKESYKSSLSFAANGLVFADRKPYPLLWEIKKVQQNVGFTLVDSKNGTLALLNKGFFAPLNNHTLQWQVLENGLIVAQGKLKDLNIAPQQTETFALGLPAIADPTKEYFLDIQVVQNTATPLLDKGHVVALEQFLIHSPIAVADVATKGNLAIDSTNNSLHISNTDGFAATFDKTSGMLTTLAYHGKNMIKAAPRPDFWRAPTDNDFPQFDYGKKLAPWLTAGTDTKLVSFKSEQLASGQVRVATEHYLNAIESRYFVTYTISADGQIDFDIDFYAAPHKKQGELPRLGTLFAFVPELEHVEWYGRGPHENYWDRKTSAHVGRYTSTVEDLFVPYVRPQENGHRTDVRELFISDENGLGVAFISDDTFEFNASFFDSNDFHRTNKAVKTQNKHPYELTKQDRVFVNIDYMQRGLGGTNSWFAPPLPKYVLPWFDYRYHFSIKPYAKQ